VRLPAENDLEWERTGHAGFKLQLSLKNAAM
jgi:hypothetical protein